MASALVLQQGVNLGPKAGKRLRPTHELDGLHFRRARFDGSEVEDRRAGYFSSLGQSPTPQTSSPQLATSQSPPGPPSAPPR